MKVALIHDWFTVDAGGEKVFRAILNSFDEGRYPPSRKLPEGWKTIKAEQIEIFSLIDCLNKEDRQNILNGRHAKTSFLQKFPFTKRLYRNFLPLFRQAVESLDLTGFDVVISSSAAVSKGVKTLPGQLHVCYCHTPIRYAWDLEEQYLQAVSFKLRLLYPYIKHTLKKLREWDLTTLPRVNYFLASSHFIAERISRIYKRSSTVIYPPVDTESFHIGKGLPRENYYLTAGRLVSYKKKDTIAQAFKMMPDKKLIIIGDGPELGTIRRYTDNNITHLDYQPKEKLVEYFQKARAFIIAAEEDFGITTVEAQACGTPVIALRKGGYLETVVENRTGLFFDEQSPESIRDAVLEFENKQQLFNEQQIRENALAYSEIVFNSRFVDYVLDKLKAGAKQS